MKYRGSIKELHLSEVYRLILLGEIQILEMVIPDSKKHYLTELIEQIKNNSIKQSLIDELKSVSINNHREKSYLKLFIDYLVSGLFYRNVLDEAS